jgi:hypothetical protein
MAIVNNSVDTTGQPARAEVSPWSPVVHRALAQPSGARFYKAALQVNPFAYVRERRTTTFGDEASYNAALVAACQEQGIEVIGITDHHRVRTSEALRLAATDARIAVIPGFELVTKDGVHVLCLFDPSRRHDWIDRVLGECGIRDDSARTALAELDCTELVERADKWDAVFVAAHATGVKDGILGMSKGQARAHAWRARGLLAAAIPGPVSDLAQEARDILLNKNPDYRRERALAIINAADVCDPADLAKPGSSTYIKMTAVTIEGLRQAFLDPDSRVRRASDPPPEPHAELVSLAWEGGFLDGLGLHLNENLNVLIGGRGAGKSTVIEAIRYALGIDPVGEEARRLHDGIVRNVLGGGTKVSLLVRTYRPSPSEYLIERDVNERPSVRSVDGKLLALAPTALIPGVDVYGQHEISELTRSPEKLTQLLNRFVERDTEREQQKADLRRDLEESRKTILATLRELAETDAALAELPALEDTLERFRAAGVEEKLKEKSDLVREEQVLEALANVPIALRGSVPALDVTVPARASAERLDGLPNASLLSEGSAAIERLAAGLAKHQSEIEALVAEAEATLRSVRARWDERRKPADERYRAMLRELQRDRIDGTEYMRIQEKIIRLQPLRETRRAQKERIAELEKLRHEQLVAWDALKAEDFRATDRAARRVSELLTGRVRVRVQIAGDRRPLLDLLREHLSGRTTEMIDTLARREQLSLSALAHAIRQGSDTLVATYGFTKAQAEKLAGLETEYVLELEELDLPPTTHLQLNVATAGQPASWREIDALSTGQKATTVLLLLLLEGDAPLVVDQPEDDLDNRFITEEVVPQMKREKRRRQFIFSTHNANIPVLADAELILGMVASGDATRAGGTVAPEHMGAIDSAPIRELLEVVLEGGREAFLTRKLKYGF